jgi:hypothetical protein
MKYIIKESQYKLLIEQSNGSSAATCDKNISKSAGYLDNWKSMDENKRKELLKSIRSNIEQALSRSKEEYIKWFQHPTTIKKFRTPKEREVLKKLPSYLQSINKIKLSFKGTESVPQAIAWVQYSSDPTLVNYNISQIHDGTNFQGDSLETTTKHEMGHLIDDFFKKNGAKTYNQTIDTSTQQAYNDNYLINDKDQYARLNVLRGIVGAGPNDHPSTLLNKFMEQVKNGKITSNKFNFSPVVSKTPALTQKNNNQATKEIWRLLINNLLVDGKPDLNTGQLFSNFAVVRNGVVYVSFDLLAQFNLTAKDIDKKYYTLKMTPK